MLVTERKQKSTFNTLYNVSNVACKAVTPVSERELTFTFAICRNMWPFECREISTFREA